METRFRTLTGLVLVGALLACFVAGTPQPVPQGVYRVVTTRPVLANSWRMGEEYRDDEHLTRAFNQLSAEGFDPVFVQPTVSTAAQLPVETRLVIVGRKR
jgi:hypothetical protein